MAKARTMALKHPMAGVKKAMDATAETVCGAAEAAAKGVSKGIYYPFFCVSFGATYGLLTAFSLILNSPVGNGIKDGAIAATKAKAGKKAKGK